MHSSKVLSSKSLSIHKTNFKWIWAEGKQLLLFSREVFQKINPALLFEMYFTLPGISRFSE